MLQGIPYLARITWPSGERGDATVGRNTAGRHCADCSINELIVLSCFVADHIGGKLLLFSTFVSRKTKDVRLSQQST